MFLEVLFRDSQALILSCSISSRVVVQIWSVGMELCPNEPSVIQREDGIWIMANMIPTGMTQRWEMSTFLHESSAKKMQKQQQQQKKTLGLCIFTLGKIAILGNNCCFHGKQTFLLIVDLCFFPVQVCLLVFSIFSHLMQNKLLPQMLSLLHPGCEKYGS